MNATKITQSDKDALSQLARRLVERGLKPTDAAVSPHKLLESTDILTIDGILLRIIESEKKSNAENQALLKTLNAILSTVERLESRVARLDGEVFGLHEREGQRDCTVQQQSEDLKLSASLFADKLAAQIEEALLRIGNASSNITP